MADTMKKQIPFIDLAAQQQRIRKNVEQRMLAVLDHGRYIMGPEIGELEAQLADYCAVKHAVACGSGTDALLMGLMASGVQAGDVVFTTPFTFIATAEVVSLLGAINVFVDIRKDSFNISPNALAKAAEKAADEYGLDRLKGVIPVDLFGQPSDYDQIIGIAESFGMEVWEDAAQSFGATYKGNRTCAFGEWAATSFFPAKPLGCYGDGGAVFCNDDELAERLRSIRVHGKGSHKYDNVRIGINGRMDTLQAAVLLEKLTIFDEEVALRDKVARRYNERLAGIVETPEVRDHNTSTWAQYSVLCDNREQVMARLKEQGVPTAIYYPKPLHLQDAFSDYDYQSKDFPVTESVMNRIFSLPMHPYLSEEDQDYIIEAVREAVR